MNPDLVKPTSFTRKFVIPTGRKFAQIWRALKFISTNTDAVQFISTQRGTVVQVDPSLARGPFWGTISRTDPHNLIIGARRKDKDYGYRDVIKLHILKLIPKSVPTESTSSTSISGSETSTSSENFGLIGDPLHYSQLRAYVHHFYLDTAEEIKILGDCYIYYDITIPVLSSKSSSGSTSSISLDSDLREDFSVKLKCSDDTNVFAGFSSENIKHRYPEGFVLSRHDSQHYYHVIGKVEVGIDGIKRWIQYQMGNINAGPIVLAYPLRHDIYSGRTIIEGQSSSSTSESDESESS